MGGDALRSWSCLEVILSARNPFWLSCRIWCFSPYADSINIRVMVKNLFIVFVRAIGMWFVSCEGSHFLYRRMIRLVSYDDGICCCL